MTRHIEARAIWDWLQWRLPPALWLECQQVLANQTQPEPSDPQLAQGLADILNPATPNAQRLVLLQQLLTIIKDAGFATDDNPKDK